MSISVRAKSHSQLDKIVIFGHARFLTAAQYSMYSNISLSTGYKELANLISYGLVEKNDGAEPTAYTLTSKGYMLLDIGKPQHFMSSQAIHQWLMRSQVELQIREKNDSANFISRKESWALGFYPAIAEHLLRFELKGKSELAVVVIDDYLMAENRIKHLLWRNHDERKTKVSSQFTMRYADVCKACLIYTTEKSRVKKLTVACNEIADFKGQFSVRFIKAIWNI